MPVTRLKNNGYFSAVYRGPKSGSVKVRVESERAVSVYALDAAEMRAFQQGSDFYPIWASRRRTEHEGIVDLGSRADWYLVIWNKSGQETAVFFEVYY